MNCKKCGNKNPDYARFCVFCGEAIEQADKPAPPPKAEPKKVKKAPPAEVGLDIAPAKRRNTAPRAQGATVKPILENPAQPMRRAKVVGEAPAQKPTIKIEEPAKREAPIRERPAPIKRPPEKKKTNTLVPERAEKKPGVRPAIIYGDEDAEEEEYESGLKHKIISAFAGVLLLFALSVAFWLIVTPGGQVFRAGLGLSAPASAYKQLGDSLREKAQFSKAADAYYNALKLDSGNYEYALLVAKTQVVVGNLEKAETAYALCIQIDPAKSEPYQLLAELYEQQGKDEQLATLLATAYQNTADPAFRQDEVQEPQEEQVVPAEPVQTDET